MHTAVRDDVKTPVVAMHTMLIALLDGWKRLVGDVRLELISSIFPTDRHQTYQSGWEATISKRIIKMRNVVYLNALVLAVNELSATSARYCNLLVAS